MRRSIPATWREPRPRPWRPRLLETKAPPWLRSRPACPNPPRSVPPLRRAPGPWSAPTGRRRQHRHRLQASAYLSTLRDGARPWLGPTRPARAKGRDADGGADALTAPEGWLAGYRTGAGAAGAGACGQRLEPSAEAGALPRREGGLGSAEGVAGGVAVGRVAAMGAAPASPRG